MTLQPEYADAEAAAPFSQVLRERSRTGHQSAEGSRYLAALTDGRLDRSGYAAMVVQHWHIYRALEAIAEGYAGHPVAEPFVLDELNRTAALAADLEHLLGPAEIPAPYETTRRYVERIEAQSSWPAGFVAHHYVRYLGDLSGGLIIGRMIAQHYELESGRPGVLFYHFDRIQSPKRFKEQYRRLLDAAPWSPAEQERIVAEVLLAYELNIAVFAELADREVPAAT